ncbi:hypothetical protein [Phycicoccus flavus]|uniref:hypothetical protein n=1 Tax=Phycicoccus flavus TaxID=2502783 RepID=UPI000FEBB6F6|nr:hypothetical protein [Phycicoccus flavus]NHA66613.1 hypothetical protein [Phycicoccus flavus]
MNQTEIEAELAEPGAQEILERTFAHQACTGRDGTPRAMYDQQVRIVIRPTWARFYDFGAGRIPASLQRLAEQSAAGASHG